MSDVTRRQFLRTACFTAASAGALSILPSCAGLEMGQAGRNKVLEHHTWEIVTDRVRTVYAEAISRHAQGK